MKILCFGDSVTWGTKQFGIRYNKNTRWTKLLEKELGEGYTVFEDGLCGREAGILQEDGTSTKGFLYKSIIKYYPFDVLFIMLGITDLRIALHLTAEEIAKSVEDIVSAILGYNYEIGSAPRIIIASPPHVKSGVSTSPDAYIYGQKEDAINTCKQLAPLYKDIADRLGQNFFDAAKHCEVGEYDFIHLDENGHKAFAEALAKYIKTNIQPK